MILPWQELYWQQFQACLMQNRLPHALLFIGPEGIGKKQFANTLANALLCKHPADNTRLQCGECHACRLLQANSHPDLIMIEPDQSGQIIKIDSIRDAIQAVGETAQQGGLKIIIIHPATAMNINASNALLKTLEEPPPNVLVILISHQHTRLPATIISRCQKMVFEIPDQKVALSWLQSKSLDANMDLTLLLNLADGAPLKALSLAESDVIALRKDFYQNLCGPADPLKLAAQWQEANLILLMDLLCSWLRDLLRFKLTNGQCELVNSDYRNLITEINQKISRENLVEYSNHVQKIYAKIQGSLSLNKQLLLEELFIGWRSYVSH